MSSIEKLSLKQVIFNHTWNRMEKEFEKYLLINRSVSFLPTFIIGEAKSYEVMAKDREKTLYRLYEEINRLKEKGFISPQAQQQLLKQF